MRFILNGVTHELDAPTVAERARGVTPEPVQAHGVRIENVTFPVKQAFELALRLDRAHFTSHTAIRHLRALGFDITGRTAPSPRTIDTRPPAPSSGNPDQSWPWEGAVQTAFAQVLHQHDWLVTAMADTATKAPGVDVLAPRERPAPRRRGEGLAVSRLRGPSPSHRDQADQPSTQAGHWFSQALFKAIMLLDSHPGHESLMVLPDYPRYRDLTQRTRTGRNAAAIHVVLLSTNATYSCDTWKP
ncbi:hypothetical protein AB0M20_00475 [Actinoplanes sp. NPDC051633]|uniref:hypothetical protein n=1 Tax=Actinoplanes sp. NPDC051633 TaxID=3155670 RepID=UPI003422C2BB